MIPHVTICIAFNVENASNILSGMSPSRKPEKVIHSRGAEFISESDLKSTPTPG